MSQEKDLIHRNTLADPDPGDPRSLAEEVRRLVRQLRACAPDLTGAQAFHDALVLTARNHAVTTEEIETQLAAWAKGAVAGKGEDHYEAALAAWAKGDMKLAAEEARRAALHSAVPVSGSNEDPIRLDRHTGDGAETGNSAEVRSAAAKGAFSECRAWLLLSQIQYGSGELRDALEASRKAMAASISAEGPVLWAEAASQVAWILEELGEPDEAEPLLRSIVRALEHMNGQFPLEAAAALNNLGGLLRNTGRLEEAETHFRRAQMLTRQAFGDNHPHVAICLNNLAGLLRVSGREAEAEPLIREALRIDEAHYGEEHPSVALYLNNLATLVHALGRPDEAVAYARRALEIDERLFGEDHPAVASDLENLAVLLRTLNRHAEAEPLLRRSIELAERRHGPDHYRVAAELTHLSMLLFEMDRGREAGDLSRRAVKATLTHAALTGRPAPGTRLVGQAYCHFLRRLGIPDDEMQSMLFMMKREVEQETSGIASSSSWLEAVMDEMEVPYGQGTGRSTAASLLN